MRLTDEQVMQDNKRFANCNALAELKYCGWDIPHRKSITNDEIHFYAWLCRSAVAMLKEQETMMQCIKGKCRICPHCANCNVDENGLLKEQEAVEPRVSTAEQRCGHCNKVIEMDGWQSCPWCGKRIDWKGWWKKNGTRN